MNVIPILFEDHSLTHFRPLTWSRPTFEVRTGIFSLRERVGHLAENPLRKGVLLGRPILDGLQQASGWIVGSNAAAVAELTQTDGTFLWINGRTGWGHERLRSLVAMATLGTTVLIQDGGGLLAFSCSGPVALKILDSWEQWEKGASTGPGWCAANSVVPAWQPELPVGIATSTQDVALQWIWDIVPGTRSALAEDLSWARNASSWNREPHGILAAADNPDPVWARSTCLTAWPGTNALSERAQVLVQGEENFWCGPDVNVSPGSVIDATSGPVVLDRNVTIMPHCYLQGPLYIGPGSTVKAGAAIYGESSFGIGNRIAGEIGESVFGDFANKQHDGFIGHAVLGSWINLGAMTTCSDLKNNYGNVRVDLGAGQVDSGQRFVGLLMADQAKTAIGTLFNTGTCVGFASNIFGGEMPPKFVGNFAWGGQKGGELYAVERALETAAVVMSRRGCLLTEAHRLLFGTLAGDQAR